MACVMGGIVQTPTVCCMVVSRCGGMGCVAPSRILHGGGSGLAARPLPNTRLVIAHMAHLNSL